MFAVGMLRVASALLYRKYKKEQHLAATRLWERIYEAGAWGFSALLGLLCWLTLVQTSDGALQLAVTTTAAGYAAGISGRNAGRPVIAVGQLMLTTLPMAVALFTYPDWVHTSLGVVVLLFIYGMMDITLSIRDVIIQALTMTRKEAALAARNLARVVLSTDDEEIAQAGRACGLEVPFLRPAELARDELNEEQVIHSSFAGAA